MLFRPCRRITIFVFLLLAISSTSFAQDKVAKIDELVEHFNELGQFNGSILVAENGRVIYKKGKTEGGKIYGQATGQERFELEPISETKFAVKIVGAEIEFNRDEKGVVTGLILHQGGRDTPAKRLP